MFGFTMNLDLPVPDAPSTKQFRFLLVQTALVERYTSFDKIFAAPRHFCISSFDSTLPGISSLCSP